MKAGGPISWKSKKQGCVALSSSEVEYMALASAVQEAIWLEKLLTFTMGTEKPSKVLIFVDKPGCNHNVPQRLFKHEDEAR